MKSLFLAWQAPPGSAHSRAWFPVGLLDAEPEISHYRFRYTHGAKVAHEKVGFNPLLAFPSLDKNYESSELFPLFKNRVLSSKRTDFPEYIQWLNLDQKSSDPISILSVSGGERMTDNLEVFPKVTTDGDGNFQVRFFLHGIRHLGEKAIERAKQLKVGDALRIMIELNNPATNLAVALFTEDYQPIGWAPRYLMEDLIQCAPNAPLMSAKIARVNTDGAPINQRYLIDFMGQAPNNWQPMSTPDFKPLLA